MLHCFFLSPCPSCSGRVERKKEKRRPFDPRSRGLLWPQKPGLSTLSVVSFQILVFFSHKKRYLLVQGLSFLFWCSSAQKEGSRKRRFVSLGLHLLILETMDDMGAWPSDQLALFCPWTPKDNGRFILLTFWFSGDFVHSFCTNCNYNPWQWMDVRQIKIYCINMLHSCFQKYTRSRSLNPKYYIWKSALSVILEAWPKHF